MDFLWKLATKEGLGNPYRNLFVNWNTAAHILANGPSLRRFLEVYNSNPDRFNDAEFFCVNYFVYDSAFERIKPKFFVISDPVFFVKTVIEQKGRKAIAELAGKVTWPMTLFIPYKYRKSPFLDVLKSNSFIRIIAFHSIKYFGIESLRNRFYSKGLGNGEYGTVALNAIYSAIMCGFKTIYLHGLDHTFFSDITVDHANTLCFRDIHYYDGHSELRPMINHYDFDNTHPFSMFEFLSEKANIFKGHNDINILAEYCGVDVYNCTPVSLVDSYRRMSLESI